MIDTHFLDGGTREGAIHGGDVNASFFKDLTVLENARYAITAGGAAPRVNSEFSPVESLEG